MATTHADARAQQQTTVADGEPSRSPAGSGLAAVQATRGVGPDAVAQIAGLIANHPHERNAILNWLHQHRGNAFVQQVARASTTTATAATTAASQPVIEDPVERARFEWRSEKLCGDVAAIMRRLEANASADLYLGTLATLVRTEDASSFATLQNQQNPLWVRALAEAKQVVAADTAYAAANVGNGMPGEQRIGHALNTSRDPAYQAEIMRQLKDHGQLDKVVELTYSNIGTAGASTYALGNSLANATSEGVLSIGSLSSERGGAWYDRTGAAPGVTPGALQLEQQAAQAPIEAAKREFQEAQDAVTQLDMRCARELDDMSPALSLTELKEYVLQFRSQGDYPGAVATVTRSAGDLQRAMQRYAGVEEGLLAAGRGGGSAATIVDQYIVLAASSVDGAKQAERWASEKCTVDGKGQIVAINDPHFADQQATLQQVFTNFATTTSSDIVAKVRATLMSAQSQPLPQRLAAGWSTFDATYLEPYQQIKYTAGAAKVPGLWAQFVHLDSLVDGTGKPKVHEIEKELEALKGAAAELDPLSKRLLSAVTDMFMMFGEVANGGLGNIASVSNNASEVVDKLDQTLAILRKQSTNAAAEDVETLERLNGEIAATGGNLAKMIPFLDAATGGYAMLGDLQTLASTHGKDPFTYAQFLGDSIATLGGLAEMAPPPWDVLGKILNVAGQAVSSAAGLLDHLFNGGGNPIQDEKRSVLAAMDTDPRTKKDPNAARDAAISTDAAVENLQIAQNSGMSRATIDGLIAKVPSLFDTDHAMQAFSAIQQNFEGGCYPTMEDRQEGHCWYLSKHSFEQFLTTAIDRLGASGLVSHMNALCWNQITRDTLTAAASLSIYPVFFGRLDGNSPTGGVFEGSQWTMRARAR